MTTNPQQPTQDSPENPLLLAFDFLYARVVERPSITMSQDTQQEIDQDLLALLSSLLLEFEQSKEKEPNAPLDGKRYLEQAYLVLDADGMIESFSMSIPEALAYPIIRLAKRPFSSLLSQASTNSWEGLLTFIQGRVCFHTVTALTLLSLHHQALPSICTVAKLLNSNRLQISCLFILQHLSPGVANISQQMHFRNDAPLLERLHDLILEHLDCPLPSIPQLAKQLGTNTFTLKDGFKRYYNMGIYQFYTQERLAKAKVMLLETDLALPNIAEECGFSSASTLSKAFKRKYGVAPLPFKKMHNNL